MGDHQAGVTAGRSLGNGYFDSNTLKVDLPRQNSTLKTLTRNSEDDMHMFYLKNKVYGHLVPDIKLYKVVNVKQKFQLTLRDVETEERYQTETEKYMIEDILPLEFPRSIHEASIEGSAPGLTADHGVGGTLALSHRAGQIGIKSFNWRYVGTDAFTADKDIEAELTLTMDGIEALFAERKNSLGQTYRISDALILPQCYEDEDIDASPQSDQTTPKYQTLGPSDTLPFKPECFELIVDAGYSCDTDMIVSGTDSINDLSVVYKPFGSDSNPPDSDFPQVARQSFDKFRSSLFLGVVDHEFNFNENGSVEVEIKYRGRLGGRLRSSQYNIVFSFELRDRLAKLERSMEKLRTKAAAVQESKGNTATGWFQTNEYEEEYEEAKEEYDGLVKSNHGRFFQNVVNYLRVNQKIYSLNLDGDQVKYLHSYLAQGRKTDLHNYINSMTTNGDLSDPATVQAVTDNDGMYDDMGFAPIMDYTIPNPFLAGVNGLRRQSVSSLRNFLDSYSTDLSRLEEGHIETVDLEAQDVEQGRSYGGTTGGYGSVNFTCYLGKETPKNIPFIFYGDLIDAVMQQSGLDAPMYDSRIILGDIRLPKLSPLTGDIKDQNTTSLASIPITIPRLFNFITKEITAQSAIEMPLTRFISLSLNKLVKESLGLQTIENALQTDNINFKLSYMTHYPTPSTPADPTKDTVDFNDPADLSAQSLASVDAFDIIKDEIVDLNKVFDNVNSTIERSRDHIKYLVDHPPISLMIIRESDEKIYLPTAGDMKADFLQRIPHFSIGQNFGLIKNVKLSKTDQPFLREGRFQKLGGHYSVTQLSNVYDAQFEMFGNDLNTLGGIIYFNPDSLSPLGLLGDPQDQSSLSYLLGFGGLHLITLIDHSMTPGDYTTTVKARFVSRGFVKANS